MFKSLMICFFFLCASFPAFAQDVPRADITIPFAPDSMVRISPDFSRMVVIEPDQTIIIYDLTDYESRVIVSVAFDDEETGRIEWVVWKEDSSLILFRTERGLYLLNALTGDIQTVYTSDSDEVGVGGFAFLHEFIIARIETRSVVGFLSEYEIYAWDAQTLEQTLFLPAGDDCLREAPADDFAAEVVAVFRTTPCPRTLWSPDQTRYLFWSFWNSSAPKPIEVYDAETQTLLFELKHCAMFDGNEDCEMTAELEEVSWSPDGTKIISLPLKGRDLIRIWDGRTGEQIQSLGPVHDDGQFTGPLGLTWHTNSQIATWEDTGHIFIWDLETGELMFDWYHNDNVVRDARWIKNGQLVVTWGDGVPGSRVVGQIWHASSGEKLALIIDSTLKDVVENADRSLLYFIFYDRVDIWYVDQFAEVWHFEPGP